MTLVVTRVETPSPLDMPERKGVLNIANEHLRRGPRRPSGS